MERKLILLFILIIGLWGHNRMVALAAFTLLILDVLKITIIYPYMERYGINIGILILTIAVLTPIAENNIRLQDILGLFKSSTGIISLAIGIFVAILGGKGVSLLAAQPQIITGVLVGTIIGTSFLGGVPVGPLIAAGIISLLMSIKT
ncbi:DUF441 domain-containing protein [Desulfolucanica intricata]|uniref:DUF441 domain-containing protein n=1 Tax=Desulfolucanica intricata TaxID=1285191 RepID=UPI00082A42C7|nr:DUF441 domain-containing protein [Desulfolucanica intricata]